MADKENKDKDAAAKKKSTLKTAAAQVQTQQKKSGGVREYFKGVRVEIKRVVWPTRKELVSFTGVVLLTCVIFGVGIWAVDSGFLAALKAVLNISM